MSKVALYFRRWKNYTRQKNVGEDWAFATKLTDIAENFDETENGCSDLEIFQVKFLGSSIITAAKSEEVTASAIKNIISTAKAVNKKLQRLKLSICPKGIETFDTVTGETLHRISIYEISYCSADAAHSNVFAFVAGTGGQIYQSATNNETDELTCYAFLCSKRKIAHNLTITVAKNFERAYELWKKSEQRKIEQCEIQSLNSTALRNKSNAQKLNEQNHCDNHLENDVDQKNLLIDFQSDATNNIAVMERQRQILQTTWVSFDDEPLMNENNDIQPMSSKHFENNLWDMNVNGMNSQPLQSF